MRQCRYAVVVLVVLIVIGHVGRVDAGPAPARHFDLLTMAHSIGKHATGVGFHQPNTIDAYSNVLVGRLFGSANTAYIGSHGSPDGLSVRTAHWRHGTNFVDVPEPTVEFIGRRLAGQVQDRATARGYLHACSAEPSARLLAKSSGFDWYHPKGSVSVTVEQTPGGPELQLDVRTERGPAALREAFGKVSPDGAKKGVWLPEMLGEFPEVNRRLQTGTVRAFYNRHAGEHLEIIPPSPGHPRGLIGLKVFTPEELIAMRRNLLAAHAKAGAYGLVGVPLGAAAGRYAAVQATGREDAGKYGSALGAFGGGVLSGRLAGLGWGASTKASVALLPLVLIQLNEERKHEINAENDRFWRERRRYDDEAYCLKHGPYLPQDMVFSAGPPRKPWHRRNAFKDIGHWLGWCTTDGG